MLSDSCFDLNLGLKQGYHPVATVQGFIDDIRHYADPPFDYPKEVIDRLIELAERWLASGEVCDLVILFDAAETVRRFYDRSGPYSNWESEAQAAQWAKRYWATEWDLRVEKNGFRIFEF